MVNYRGIFMSYRTRWVELPEVDVLDEGDVILGMPVAAVADLAIKVIDLFLFATDTQL
jgi:hypothetical protein